jgi:hypothetical protein
MVPPTHVMASVRVALFLRQSVVGTVFDVPGLG